MAESLREKQSRFARMMAQLINHATLLGYEVTVGDFYRDPRVHGGMGVKKSYSHADSNHKQRLAGDLNLFKDGRWLSQTSDHQPLGEYWESIGGAWGGRFGDGNHYSLEHNGIK